MAKQRSATNWDDVADAVGFTGGNGNGNGGSATAVETPPSPIHQPATDNLCVSLDFPLSGARPEITDPFGGESFDSEDVDGLIGLYEKLDGIDKRAYAAKCEIRRALAAKAAGHGETKTKRVIGHLRAAKLEFPNDRWSQPELKRLWEERPQWARTYLRISEIAPNMREVKKLENAAGDGDFEAFRNELLAANLGPGESLPTLKIER